MSSKAQRKGKPSEPQLSPQEMRALAEADHQKWSGIAADPLLSPKAATVARNNARSAAAELKLWDKALSLPQQSEEADPLGKALGIIPSPPSQPNPSNEAPPST